MKRFTAYVLMALSVSIGGGSLLLFGLFLILGPLHLLSLGVSDNRILLWDGILSLFFFVQHSGMIRSSFRNRFAPLIPRHYHPSLYAIASGISLTAVSLLWKESQTVLYDFEGLFRFLARFAALCAIAGFWWGVSSLEHFDTFGLVPLKSRLMDRPLRTPNLVLRGPYRWVRHPLYFFTLLLIWSIPSVTADRLLFNVLWSLWIVLGSYLEEKDLVTEFGDRYRHYQKTVPMLFPWQFF